MFLTDKEVPVRLKISRRTLQDYRNEGRISYYQLGGKILYAESQVEQMLKDGYKTAFKLKRWIYLIVLLSASFICLMMQIYSL